MIDIEEIQRLARPKGMPFRIGKIGHVVVNVRDVGRSVRFYTEMLGFEVSDIYPHEMVPGGMAFLRCNPDHHGIALVGSLSAAAENVELNHIAFEVATLEEVVRARDHLVRHGVAIDFEGRRRAGLTRFRGSRHTAFMTPSHLNPTATTAVRCTGWWWRPSMEWARGVPA